MSLNKSIILVALFALIGSFSAQAGIADQENRVPPPVQEKPQAGQQSKPTPPQEVKPPTSGQEQKPPTDPPSERRDPPNQPPPGSRPRPPETPPTGTAVPRGSGQDQGQAPNNPGQSVYQNTYPFYQYPWPWEPYYRYQAPCYSYLVDGSIRLNLKPKNASVYIDEGFVGIVDNFDGAFQELKLREGIYSIEIRAEGYGTYKNKIRILPGRKITLDGDLNKK